MLEGVDIVCCFQFWSFLVSYVEEGPWWSIQSPKREKEESERLRGKRDQIKFIDLRFEG